MALTKWRPQWGVRPTEIDRWFSDMFREPFWPEKAETDVLWAPALDFSETETEYIIKLEAPGIPKENMDVSFDNGVLTLSGRREETKKQETEKFIYREREEGRFVRSLRVPTAILADKIVATYENGVLNVKLPKEKKTVGSKVVIK